MNQAFRSREFSFLLQNLAVSLVIFGIHSYLISYLATDFDFFFPLWQIYLFHFVVTTVLYTIINYKYSNGKTDIFNIFMVITFLKMTLAIVFLLPLLLSDFENKQPDVFNFFIPYFMYLFFEVYSVTQFLQKKP
jgi:hypothetical protein